MEMVEGLKRKSRLVMTLPIHAYWYMYASFTKSRQRSNFNAMKQKFNKLYMDLKHYPPDTFTTSAWNDFNIRLESRLLPVPSFSFLQDPLIRQTMFVTAGGKWLKEELSYLESVTEGGRLNCLLEEDLVGVPLVINLRYLTSHNSIHHLYHILRFSNRTSCQMENIKSVVEWGGGYGNMAKLFKRIAPFVTYTIIDSPLFSALQWLYLSTIFGDQNVNLIVGSQSTPKRGVINIVPSSLVHSFAPEGDLFISTWALSECSRAAQEFVGEEKKWFKSTHLLLAYQSRDRQFEYAERVGEIAKTAGAIIEEISFLPGHYYAFL